MNNTRDHRRREDDARRRRMAYSGRAIALYSSRRPLHERQKMFRDGYNGVSGLYTKMPPLSVEKKWVETAYTVTPVPFLGSIQDSINLVVQNATQTGRIGRKITIVKVHFKWLASVPIVDGQPTIVPNSDVLRLMMYHDKQCNGATATVSDLLAATDILTYRNLSQGRRFKVIMDKSIDLHYHNLQRWVDGMGGSFYYATSQMYSGEFHQKVNIPIEFDGAAGLITEVTSNNIGLLAISQWGRAELRSRARIRYTDV